MSHHGVKQRRVNFLIKALTKHNGLYDYNLDTYQYADKKMEIVCPIHGVFNQTPSSHLNGCGCPLCAGNVKLEIYGLIEKCSTIHNNKYIYCVDNFSTIREYINIWCPIHGKYEQSIHSHLRQHGCPRCGKDSCKFLHYTNKVFNDNPSLKVKSGRLYYLLFENKTTSETFYKVGITVNSINERFGKFYRDLYNITVIYDIEMEIYKAFQIEQTIIKDNKINQYIVPNERFGGKTECFSNDILPNNLLFEIVEKYDSKYNK